MSEIKASELDVPLFEVVEHIAGDLGQVVLQYEDLDPKESEFLQVTGVDSSDERGRARFLLNWEAALPVDGAIVQAWDRALADLIGAVGRAELRVKGRGPGSLFLRAISPGDFAEVADNPIADSIIEYSGKRVLEFNAGKATIVEGHSIGASTVVWADVCAESGAEVLKLWPLQRPETAKDTGNAAADVRESAVDETTPPPREESKSLPPLQERTLEIARGLWPDGAFPPRIADRDNKILQEWPDKESPPNRKTIQRAFKNWTLPDK